MSRLASRAGLDYPLAAMSIPPPETTMVTTRRVSCDGADGIRPGPNYVPSALGHPRVWLEIDEHGYVDCGYCDRRFVLAGGPADGADHAALRDIPSGAS
jgi:NADH dehydrogenase (ubiquinone) Fe-S protein 6